MTKKATKKSVIPYQGESMPWDEDAEEAVISCILNDPGSVMPDVELTIPDEYFYHPGNQVIFKEMKAMASSGKPVEYKALTGWLRDKGVLDRVGGGAHLSKCLNALMSSANFNHYRSRLKDKWLLRRGLTLCAESHADGSSFHGEDASVWTEKLASEALQLHQAAVQQGGIHMGSDLEQACDEMERRGSQVGVPTPFPWFNKKFGGCVPGTLYLFGGKRGLGKSALTRQIGWHIAKVDHEPVEVITFEMDKVQEFRRICSLEGVDQNSWLTGELSDREKEIVQNVKRAGKQIPYKIHDDVKTLEQTISRIRMGFLKRKTRIWIVDGPQRIKGDSREGRERELSGIGWALKEEAKNNGLCIICPVHLNSEGVARGSEDLENHADLFCRLAKNKEHKPTFLEPWDQILARNSKNRNGPEEDEGCLFRFTGKHLKFEEEGRTDISFEASNPYPRRKA